MIRWKANCRRPATRKAGICDREPDGCLKSFEAIVDAYIRDFRYRATKELGFFKQHSLPQTIRIAALCKRPDGKRHSHQCRIPRLALAEAESLLQEASKHLRTSKTFDDLHSLVQQTIGCIKGIGRLTVYDVTTRIGARLGLSPARIYLHAGTAKGASAMVSVHGRDTISRSELPATFRRLRVHEVEDCLCIYKRELQEIAHLDPTNA